MRLSPVTTLLHPPKFKKTLNILFVTPEAAPFAKVGGLGEVMFSLPRALQNLGHDARVMMPRYASVDREKYNLKMVFKELEVPSGGEAPPLICNVLLYNGPEAVPTFFLENMEYYEKRANVYGYSDDPIRWVLLSRGVLEFLRKSEWLPDIIVANDWQTGFIPNLLHTEYKNDPILDRIATVFIIHNLYHQGMFDHRFVPEMEYDAGQDPIGDIFGKRLFWLNGMRRGIMYADVIATVSPTYAKEILTKEYGEGLENLLLERRTRLYGILNGIDYEKLNPATDPYITAKYDINSFGKRAQNKLALQEQFGLEKNPKTFLMGIVSRMDAQKGFDLIMGMAHPLFREVDCQLTVLGTGENKYRLFFKDLMSAFPKRVGAHFDYDPVLPRLIFGGADVILIPSMFEPCGLTQMEAMRYGAIPIARKTGGLADTITDFTGEGSDGNGFLFEKADSWALFAAIIRSRETYRYPKIWNGIIRNAMAKDFSWHASAKKYVNLFFKAIEYHKRLI
jgi:starch synthase